MTRWTTANLAERGIDAAGRRVAAASVRAALPVPLESDVQPAIINALRMHPAVAWVERVNSGGMRNSAGQFVRFGYAGQPDLTGQMRDGRRLDVEVKRPGNHPTVDQAKALARVRRNGGVAFVATSVDDVIRELRKATEGKA